MREISADSGRASVAHALACFVVSHFEYCVVAFGADPNDDVGARRGVL